MTPGERIKLVRKELGLTLEKFGNKIGMKRNSMSQIETGKNSATDQTIKSICREFSVNEDWLRNGIGEMFIDTDEDFAARIDRIMAGEDENRKNLFKVMLELSDEDVIALKNLFDKAIEVTQSSKINVDDIPDTPEELEKKFPPVDIDPKDNAG